MSRVQIKAPPSRWKWIAVAGLGLVLAAWWLGPPLPSRPGEASEAPPASQLPPGQGEVSVSPREPGVAPGADLASLQAELDVAARALSTDPAPAPAQDAPVRERPGYVSPMEWLVLKRVADRHADPQAELTRMVHFLRFHKLLERWQTLPADVPPAERRRLAANLVADLPHRVAQGDVGLTDARAWLPRLVAELEPDANLREERLATEMGRVASAVPTRPPG